VAWLAKGYLHPVPATSVSEFVSRFALGAIPGTVMVAIGLIFNGTLFGIGFATSGIHRATGEVLPKYGEFPVIDGLREALDGQEPSLSATPAGSPSRPFRRRSQFLTFVVTAQPDVVAARVLKEMHRGVTGLQGKGMYTQQDREILMIAVTTTEIAHLEQLVREEDPNAFVVVAPAQEILGRGFQPLAS
jgi:Uncharacterized protein conserved in bacteria (DUF2179)